MPIKHPPRVRLVLRVGVTGHRPNRLVGADEERLRESVQMTLALIRQEVLAVLHAYRDFFSEQDPRLCLISPLAEGADRIVAQEALHLGYQVLSPFPFNIAEYTNDFATIASKEEFQKLASQSSTLFQLDGDRNNSNRAYDTLGATILKFTDLLVTIWDGSQSRGPGGTAEVVRRAIELGIPTIQISARPPHAVSLLNSPSNNLVSAEIREHLEYILLPGSEAEAASVLRFQNERQPKWNFALPFKIFCKIWVPQWPNPTIRVRDFDQEAEIGAQEWKRLPKMEDIATQIEENFLSIFSWADGLAATYADRYRSSFTATYLLAALATMLAFGGLLSGKTTFFASELVLLFMILSITVISLRRQWRKRWMDYRLLAEGLRHAALLVPLGTVSSFMQVRSLNPSTGRRWFNCYLRPLFLNAHMNLSTLTSYRSMLQQAIDDQERYHARNRLRMSKLHHRLQRTALLLFWIAALGCLLNLLPSSLPLDSKFHSLLERITALWLVTLPSLAVALIAIDRQGEIEQTALRSHAMGLRLKQLANTLRTLQPGADSETLRRIALNFSELCRLEIDDLYLAFERILTPL